ncbi:hypothetical protein CgunFtcFv8_010207 [Champsocephalus gunnari]|uniref:Phosphatidic acid phosphatase type 2/haloperoxidase domain-containing protein n=1 Tax=Champsocephalus gunnari TaxID=52237 RepID=A0AAN8HZ91_CHAGU|nr:hypothetical protein CgunFtcFv8_010207 [Champsocephalus gunnari]
MRELLSYLHEPELVARFQRRCGLFLVRDPHHGPQGKREHAADEPRAQRNGRRDHQDKNSNYEIQQNGCAVNFEVRNRFLHVLFLVSAALGHEVFYITCLPFIHWSLDPFLCRRLVNMWTAVMYVGQVMKDVLKLPRPTCPPVVKLEPRVDAEYGLPSTHAMAATAISFTVLLSAPCRIQFQFEWGLLIAVTLSSLVCLSRLYTGMHSVLDVLSGVLISALILSSTYPYWESIDRFQLSSSFSPLLGVCLPLLLSYSYPQLDHYSTTRGDTTTILGASGGCWVGYWLDHQLGGPLHPLGEKMPARLPPLTLNSVFRGGARSLLGVVALLGTRQLVKTLSLKALFSCYSVETRDPDARRRREIEVPYKLVTYMAVGLVNSLLVNRGFVLLGLL